GRPPVLPYQKIMAVVGFEPTPPERLEPKSSALDRSATLPGVSNSSDQNSSVRKLEWRAKPAGYNGSVGIGTNASKTLEPREPATEGTAREMMEMLEVRANHVRAVQRLRPLCHPDCMKSKL